MIKQFGQFCILAAATFLVVIGLHYALSGTVHMGAKADEGHEPPAKAEAAPEAPAAPAKPAPMLTFRSTGQIAMPTAIEVDGSVACRMDGTVLRCTARRVAK